jgi:hypothetical protein
MAEKADKLEPLANTIARSIPVSMVGTKPA